MRADEVCCPAGHERQHHQHGMSLCPRWERHHNSTGWCSCCRLQALPAGSHLQCAKSAGTCPKNKRSFACGSRCCCCCCSCASWFCSCTSSSLLGSAGASGCACGCSAAVSPLRPGAGSVLASAASCCANTAAVPSSTASASCWPAADASPPLCVPARQVQVWSEAMRCVAVERLRWWEPDKVSEQRLTVCSNPPGLDDDVACSSSCTAAGVAPKSCASLLHRDKN